MNYNYAIILVLIILIIGYFMYSSGSPSPTTGGTPGSTPGGTPGGTPGSTGAVCTNGQVCMTSCTTVTPTNMYEFIFEYKYGGTLPVFADVYQDNSGTNANHFMIIEDTSKKSSGSGIIYQYFLQSGGITAPFFGSNGVSQVTSGMSGAPFAMLICASTYGATQTNPITGYIGVVVTYTFQDTTLSYTRDNVTNPNNIKIISQNITSSMATTSSYLGVCDLTNWYSNLSGTDRELVGLYQISTPITVNNVAANDLSKTNFYIVNTGTNFNISDNKTNKIPYGISIFSYTLNSQIVTPPCPSPFTPMFNDIGVTYL